MMDDDDQNPANDKDAANIEAAVLGSTTIDDLLCSTRVPLPPNTKKVSFNSKSYSDVTYKDSTVHITVGAGHNNNHPSPINPGTYMHVLCVAMLHYSNPDIVGAAFTQSYSFKAGPKKFWQNWWEDRHDRAHSTPQLHNLPSRSRKLPLHQRP
jgi:hypothetical protein